MCQAIREIKEEGRMEGQIQTYIKFGYSAEDIAEELDLSVSKVKEVIASLD